MALYHQELFSSKNNLLSGNLQIIASAGAGKTEFVSERIATLIHKSIAKSDQIVAFTFTEKAAEELKFRVRAKIKELIGHQPDVGDMYIGTIHAFAFKILQEYVPRYRAFDMLDENRRLAFLTSIRRDIDIDYLFNSLNSRFGWNYYRHGIKQNWALRVFIRDSDIFREEGLTADKAVSDSFRNAHNIYLQKLEEKRFLDFSGILRIAVDSLKNNADVLKSVRDQYKFFTVDEYQDVNPIQEQLLQLISGKKNVCIVGDDDQSIYQWRGADVSNIQTFKKRYTKVSTHELLTNLRSHDKIVQAASDLISVNQPRIQKSIKDKGVKSEPGDLYKVKFNTQEEEIDWIVKKLQSLIGKEYMDGSTARKLMYSDFAFLFRSIRNEATPYIDALSEAGIPIVYSGVGGLFDTLEVQNVLGILNYFSEPDADIVYDDEYLEALHGTLHHKFKITRKKFIKEVKQLKDITKAQRRLSFQGLYGTILAMLGLSDTNIHDDEDEVMLYNLGRLSMAISDYQDAREYLTFNSIKDFIWFIRLHVESSYDSGDTNAMAGVIDAVQILTMHGTKGLGFPVVFMPSQFKRNSVSKFGPTLIDTSAFNINRFLNTTQDERRLYYVSLTRAKKFLFVTTADKKVESTRRSPHNFLFDELKDKYFLTSPIKDPTKRQNCDIEGLSNEIRFPTSYSELAYYLSCGYDYKMRFVYGFNPELMPALGFGKQVHNVINLLHKQYEKTRKVPTKAELVKLLEEHFYLRYASDSVTEVLKESARKSLEKYVKMWQKDFTMAVKTERPFELEFRNALISGSIDMIKRNEGNEQVLEVIDFKTGKPENELKHKYELQVQLYTIAAQEALGMNAQKALIHYIDTDKNDRQQVITTPEALDIAREELTFAIDGITKAEFKRDARQDKTCNTCDWSKICPKRKAHK